ncbi:MAG TPA: MmcQ/YjbR family DNA-binding protein [Aggregatilineales bacterium]|nr:MmcQ/YjbR family DNA-binding protein [Aggregatilineales bacterium]
MELGELRAYCLSRKGAKETFPFGADVLVYKVMGKMFALLPNSAPVTISLKCEPTWALILRSTYPAVQPGYHLNHEHWNSIACDGSVADEEILGMVDHSYEQVVKGFTRKQRQQLDSQAD